MSNIQLFKENNKPDQVPGLPLNLQSQEKFRDTTLPTERSQDPSVGLTLDEVTDLPGESEENKPPTTLLPQHH